MSSDKIFEATKENTPGIFALIEKGFYRHFIRVHMNILFNGDPEYDIHDALASQITRNIILPVMLESGLVYLDDSGDYRTEFTRFRIGKTSSSKVMLFRSLEPIMTELSKRARQESSEKYAKSTAYINRKADKEYILKNIKTLYECIENLNNAPSAKNPEDNIDLELVFASIREKKNQEEKL